jgi:hypothetical protein
VKRDDLIDDVAKAMTAVDTRPALRTRVMAGIDDTSRSAQHGWMVPVASGAALAVVALAWFLMPSYPEVGQVAPTMVQQVPATATPPGAPVPAPATVEVARNGSTRPSVRREPAAREVVSVVWPDAPMPDIPMLPPLAGPPPIVIEPITWDEVTIAPLNVELLEVKALVIEPLAAPDRSGV